MQINILLDEELVDKHNIVKITNSMNGVTENFSVTVEELIKIINSSIKKTEYFCSPYLPKNIIRYKVTDLGMYVFTEIKKNIWRINYEGNYYNVGFPRLIFNYLLTEDEEKKNEYHVKLYRIFAVKSVGLINDNTELFHFPYSHVNADAVVCMGANNLPNVKQPSQLETFHSFFFNSPFGEDYGSKTSLNLSMAELVVDKFNEKPFDDDVLLSAEIKFGDLFN